MEDKKTLKITSIIVAVLIAIFCITKILAAGTEFEDGEEWESTAWGYYVVTEDGEVIYSEEEYKSKEGIYTSAEQLEGDVKDKGIYYDELEGKGSIFCIEQGQQLPSRHDENEVRKMGSGDSLGNQYHNGSIESGLDPTTADALDANEKKALESESGNPEKALRGSYEYDYFKEGTYYSRSLKDSKGNINGTITTFATENDGRIRWSDGKEEIIDDEYERISWEDAYVLANSNPLADIEKNPAQLALWKLGKLNTGKKEVDSTDGDELYEKALLFGTYRQTKEEREKENGKSGPKLVDADQDYKYKFVFGEQGNYLIAGPVKIDYGDLTLTSDDAELEVRQIENFIVWGTLADSDELKDITEYVKFTDAEGNELENMNETVGTAEGEGAGKKFPKTNEDFYIKVDYNSPIYTQVVAINSLEVSFKELDVRAVGYKLSEVIVHYTEWKSNNIMWQHCTVEHEYEEETTDYDPISGEWITITETKTETETKDDHLKGDCSMGESPTCTSHDNCTITVTHEDITASPSEGILLEGETDSSTYAQMLFLLHKAELYWRRYKLVVLFGPENTPETPSPTPSDTPTPTPTETPTPDTHRTYIDIGGNVWVDLENTKTDGAGEQDDKMGTNKDYPRENVKVTLYYKELNDNSDSEGSLVTKDMIAKWAQSNFKNPTNTDENGRYDFYQLPMDKKYYVEFTYDGMTYTTTKFLAGGDTSDYKDNPNKEVYKTNSKAEEDKDERDKFNERFEEILGTGAKSYNKSKNETTGETKRGDKLVYRTETFDGKFESRLLTTTEKDDVINRYNDDDPHESGIARPAEGKYDEKENYEMTVSTRNSGLIYPFFKDNELIIFDAKDYENNKEDKLEYLKHINLGLVRREKADLAIAVDIKAGGTSIKDKRKLVTFRTDQEEKDMKDAMTDKDVEGIIHDEKVKQMTSGEVVQDIAGTDYYWLMNYGEIYGQNADIGIDKDKNSLNVYVLYKIILANQSDSSDTEATVTGLVDYFSEGLTVPDTDDQEKINQIFEKYKPNGYSWIVDGEKSTNVTWGKPENVKGKDGNYNAITTKDTIEIGGSGSKKEIYLVLKVQRLDKITSINDERPVLADGELRNITEITSYKITKDGKPAGLVDCDSAPYNATPGDEKTYEDDTDDAPVFKLEIKYQPKVIEGNVWEDIEGTDFNDKAKKIEHVKVELIEYVYDGNEIVKEIPRPGLTSNEANKTIGVEKLNDEDIGTRTDANGHYKFYVEGGNYAVRFTYGDEYMLKNNKQYNGQDYQAANKPLYTPLSEIYTERFNMAKPTTKALEEYFKYLKENQKLLEIEDLGGITQQPWETGNWLNPKSNNKSNARDLTSWRTKVITNAIELDNEKSDLLYQLNDGETIEDYAKMEEYTYMEAISDILIVESNDLANNPKSKDCSKVVNLALSKRPETDVKLEKKVTRIVLTASDKTILIDTSDSAKQSNLQKDPVEDIQTALMYLDTSAMEGATIDIYYTITVTNEAEESDKVGNYIYDGEVDGRSKDSKFIVDQAEDFGVLLDELKKVFGNDIENENSPIPIRADKIYDYVNINLDYKASDNGGEDAIWKKIYDEDDNSCNDINDLQIDKDIIDIGSFKKSARRVSKVLETNDKANTVKKDTGNIYATDVPDKNNVSIEIHLGMLLTEDTSDDVDDPMVYRNAAEIIQLDTFGRRDPEIIVGNYDPYNPEDETEPDSSVTGTTTIIPPTGENRAVYIVLPIISIGIVIIGIILIKKKVLKK